ncbi:acetyl-CoA carboxylase biotin carboxyl carrier protein [Fimbriimonas ginsengisoli]|uniref:Biotin carboxyl carrier protein of acetyl-CoA carboxylase n=1 Tax=Fimbriimonas ginsengisoli Gsoil 348 TaxID=661478 RepID=A0A068NXC8_FIMGI|nr:acetyl-CoA carboxylase biotin carboxyl carrier protein subunit [Fimbriimonas ginsengisoli]AIE88183.1 Biotin carboxyl carrier protein of acetyl-CoA carboxylase [Fimbriimonas ginsengisoli Gsoil 348]
MADYKETIGELAELMQEYRLTEARLKSADLTIAFRRRSASKPSTSSEESTESHEEYSFDTAAAAPAVPSAPKGIPVASPMTGIFYNSSSPGSPAFVKEGETVTAGQIIGLIEAMKVFNEIPCTASGTVLQIVAQSGQIVNPGDVIIYVG